MKEPSATVKPRMVATKIQKWCLGAPYLEKSNILAALPNKELPPQREIICRPMRIYAVEEKITWMQPFH